jgi:hypothetical protein
MEHKVLLIIDKETRGGYRVLSNYIVASNDINDWHKAIEHYEKTYPEAKYVVQYVNYATGETIKGPKYDTTDQKLLAGQSIDKHLKSGVKQVQPHENSQYEPRDRFQEIKNMNELNKLRGIIKECIAEVKAEVVQQNPRNRLKEALRGVVKNVIREIAVNNGKPELNKEEKEAVDKQYYKKGNVRLDKTNIKQQEELDKIVKDIDPTFEAYWDDHVQLIVKAQNMLYIRVTQRFENSYDVDAMVKLVDRIRAINLTWEQVKDFVKVNFKGLEAEDSTIADRKHTMSVDNEDEGEREVIKKGAGPMTGVIKNRGEKKNGKDAKIKSTPKDDKDYNEPQTKKDEDMPDRPMKQVTEPGKDPDGKNHNITKTTRVKPPKWKAQKQVKVSEKEQTTSKFKDKQLKVRPSNS